MCPECKNVSPTNDYNYKIYCEECALTYCYVCQESHYDYDDCPNKKEIYNNLDEIREALESKNVKPCPICKVIIYKEDGCNSTKCEYCKIKFCWNCLKTHSETLEMNDHECDDYGTFLADDGETYIDGY